jgi:hypothetical protein
LPDILPWSRHVPSCFTIRPAALRSCCRNPRSIRQPIEEIGAAEISLVDLGEANPDGSGSSVVAFFYASAGSYGQPELGEGRTDIVPTPVPDFERMIGGGELKDGFLLMAYGLARAKNLDLASGVATGPR